MSPGPQSALRAFDRALEIIACALLAALLVTVLLGVVTRALGRPLIWTDEGARFLMTWLAAFGWMIAGRRRAHVRIRFFQDLLPPGAWRVTETAILFSMVLVGSAIAWFGIALVRRNMDLDATSLPISMAWLYAPMIPAGLVMAFQTAAEALGPAQPRTSLAGEPVE
jgi:TRAP-type C4-dicarboxylate transport system permease small subunit